MKHANQINWWIDQTGSAHTQCPSNDATNPPLAAGTIYPDSNAGVITHLNNKPASLSLVSQDLLDVLHARFPGTRWWIKDVSPTEPLLKAQAAS